MSIGDYMELTKKYFKNNLPERICLDCGFSCCNKQGCHIMPDFLGELDPYKDYNIIKHKIKMLLDQFKYSIDWYYEYHKKRTFFLRVRSAGTPIVDHSYGNPCIMLTKNGCSLRRDKKPIGAMPFKCTVPTFNIICVKRWEKYSDILEELAREYANM